MPHSLAPQFGFYNCSVYFGSTCSSSQTNTQVSNMGAVQPSKKRRIIWLWRGLNNSIYVYSCMRKVLLTDYHSFIHLLNYTCNWLFIYNMMNVILSYNINDSTNTTANHAITYTNFIMFDVVKSCFSDQTNQNNCNWQLTHGCADTQRDWLIKPSCACKIRVISLMATQNLQNLKSSTKIYSQCATAVAILAFCSSHLVLY